MSKSNRRFLSRLLIGIGCCLIIGAGALTIYNKYDGKRAAHESEVAAFELFQKIDNLPEEIHDYAPVEVIEIIPPMPTMDIDGYAYIGILEIPALGIKLPVMEECDKKRLRRAPCRFWGNYYTDDLVIAGHNYPKHFSPIKWLPEGSDVNFLTADGQLIHYVASFMEEIDPDGVEEMCTPSKDWDLSLYTCTTGGRTRFTVRCKRVSD